MHRNDYTAVNMYFFSIETVFKYILMSLELQRTSFFLILKPIWFYFRKFDLTLCSQTAKYKLELVNETKPTELSDNRLDQICLSTRGFMTSVTWGSTFSNQTA